MTKKTGVDSEEVHLLGLSQRLHCRSQNLHQLQRLETRTNDLRGKFSSSHFAAQKNRGSVRKAGVSSTYPQGCLHYVFIAVGIVCAIWARCPLLSRNFRRHCNKRARAQIGTLERREQNVGNDFALIWNEVSPQQCTTS